MKTCIFNEIFHLFFSFKLLSILYIFLNRFILKKKKQKLKKNIQVNCDTWIGKLSHTYSLIAFKIVIKVFGFYYNGTLVASIALGHWFTLNTFKNNLLIIKVSLYSFVSFRFVYMLSKTRVKCVRACTHTFIWLIYGWISSFLF